MANVNIVRIPDKGGGQALDDLLGGRIQPGVLSSASVSPRMKTGNRKLCN
jgi:tripartite-type tricarboxylate transporter receptor subunit TctC